MNCKIEKYEQRLMDEGVNLMSSGDVLALLGIIFGSQALWNFLQSLFQKKNPWQELLIGLGHDRITSLCEQEIKTGYTTPYRFHNIVEIYEPYKRGGGRRRR